MTYSNHSTYAQKVTEFHRAFHLPVDELKRMSYADCMLRRRLIGEEFDEVSVAFDEFLAAKDCLLTWPDDPKVRKVYKEKCANLLKELNDLKYVIEGTEVAFGWNGEVAFQRVHDSNMSKLDKNGKPIYREDGKVMKSDLYKPAVLMDLV